MDFNYFFTVVSFSATIFSSFFCLILIVLKLLYTKLDFFTRRLSIVLLVFYVLGLVYHSTLLLYIFNLGNYWWCRIISFQAIILMPVVLYQIVFKLTRLKENEKFNYYHYFFSILISVVYFFFAEFLLEPILTAKSNSKEALLFDNGRVIVRVLFNTFYFVLAILRLNRYRKNIRNYSSDESQNSLRWLYTIFAIGLPLFLYPILFYTNYYVRTSMIFGQLIPSFLFMFYNISLCYNIFSQNFALVYEDIVEEEQTDSIKYKESFIDKIFFEEYFLKEKPYLNPQLKITDLLFDLTTNRSYLSGFINATYNMNFSQFINECRFKEYLELKKANKKQNKQDLILASGFRSLESFKRTEDDYNRKQLINKKPNAK